MNRDTLAGKWKQMRGQVKQWWGKLTDDDLDRIDGTNGQARRHAPGSIRLGARRSRPGNQEAFRAVRSRAPRPAVVANKTSGWTSQPADPPARGVRDRRRLVRLGLADPQLVLHRLHAVDLVRHFRGTRGRRDVRDLAAQYDDAG